MQKKLSKIVTPFFIGITITAIGLISMGWVTRKYGTENPIPGITSIVNTSFSVVDAQTESLAPSKIYLRSEALDLKKKLEDMHIANPDDLAVNLALVRFHACAPNYAGGFIGVAKQYAAYIYRQQAYIGCLAYEYIYAVNNDMAHAEEWYRLSLACKLLDGQEWRQVSFNHPVTFGIGVKGSFSNGKIQPLYENIYGTYVRKIMMPKCATDKCEFTVVPNFLRGNSGVVMGKLIFAPY